MFLMYCSRLDLGDDDVHLEIAYAHFSCAH